LSNLLFICSKNQWRSPTAELLFKGHPLHTAQSAGTSDKAWTRLSQKMIDWADVLFFMEKRHKQITEERFDPGGKTMVVMDIEDNYQYGDPELIQILQISLAEYL